MLYVKDNPANRRLVEQLVTRRPDICLLTATNGNDGIELARASQPAAILMNINLPDMSGSKALRILCEDPATAHIPVVALSACAMPRDIEKNLQAGFFRYRTTPIKIGEFIDTLNVVKPGKRGRGAVRKSLVLIATQCEGARIGRIRLVRIPDASARSIEKALGDGVDSGTVLRTDGWNGYENVAARGYTHEVIRATEAVGEDLLPHCHRVASLLKRWMLGTHQGAISHGT